MRLENLKISTSTFMRAGENLSTKQMGAVHKKRGNRYIEWE